MTLYRKFVTWINQNLISLPPLRQSGFTNELRIRFAELNFKRATNLAGILFISNFGMLLVDYNSYREGIWAANPGYVYLFWAHMLIGILMTCLLFGARFLNRFAAKQSSQWQVRWYTGFALLTTSLSLSIAALISGGVDQLLHQQITVYILGAFAISVVVYLKPIVSFFIYTCTYIIFVGLLVVNQPDYDILRGHIVNGALFVSLAYFFSITLYRLRIRDLYYQTNLEVMVEERTTMFEETNVQLEKEIIERRLSEEKVYRLASIVESTDDGIVGMTPDGIVQDWNDGAKHVYGYSSEEMIGHSILRLTPPDREDEMRDLLDRVSRGERITHLETTRTHKEGRILEVSLTVSPIYDRQGEVLGVSTIVRDISQQKAIERELSRLDRLNIVGQMAASISHEVRNPMTTVRGFLQLLYDKNELKSLKSYFDLMIDELDRANSILTEFLSISRTKITERRTQNLNEIVQSIMPLIEASAVSKKQSVKAELSEIPHLDLDGKEIRQIILNLSRNGLEAMGEGGQLTIRTYASLGEVVLAVEDEGEGIPPELLQKLGTPFFTTKDEGTGLGLAVCFGIAARHDARIEIESGETGSTFSVKFQRKRKVS